MESLSEETPAEVCTGTLAASTTPSLGNRLAIRHSGLQGSRSCQRKVTSVLPTPGKYSASTFKNQWPLLHVEGLFQSPFQQRTSFHTGFMSLSGLIIDLMIPTPGSWSSSGPSPHLCWAFQNIKGFYCLFTL